MVSLQLTLDIEWKCIYVGSAEDDKYDQILESVFIGPLQIGSMKFDFDCNPPDPSKIPPKDLIGVTAILLTCSYNNQEFFRVGYYVNVTFDNEEMNLLPPEIVDIGRVVKNILSDKPRITKFNIDWDCAVNVIPSFTNDQQYNVNMMNSNTNILSGAENSHMNNLNNRMGGSTNYIEQGQNSNMLFSGFNTMNTGNMFK